jgi:hypothetical protein
MAHRRGSLGRRCNRSIEHVGVGQRYPCRELAVVFVRHFQVGVRLLRPIRQVVRVMFFEHVDTFLKSRAQLKIGCI